MTTIAPVVYVVDDNESICRALQRLLESAGLKTATFTSPQTFLDAPRPQPVSCLVLDIRMPLIDGFRLHERLTAEGCSIPTIFITAHDNPKNKLKAEKAGAVAYLTKPFDDETLLGAIRSALGQARRTAGASKH